MPFKILAEQTRYKTETASNGLPIADFERWGNIPYMLCCPCCGMLHELPANSTHGAIFEPKCIIRATHPTVYKTWLKRFPDANQYSQIVLRQRGQALEPDELIIKTTAAPKAA